MVINRFFKENSNEIVMIKVNFQLQYEKFRIFVTFYKNLHTRLWSQSSAKKTFALAPAKSLGLIYGTTLWPYLIYHLITLSLYIKPNPAKFIESTNTEYRYIWTVFQILKCVLSAPRYIQTHICITTTGTNPSKMIKNLSYRYTIDIGSS
jgi:hypothetical protein